MLYLHCSIVRRGYFFFIAFVSVFETQIQQFKTSDCYYFENINLEAKVKGLASLQ